MAEIPPEIDETGSTGDQEPLEGDQVPAVPETPFRSILPLAETVQGLAASRPRSMGGEVAAGLMAASFTHLTNELTDTKSELRTTRDTLNSARQELEASRSRVAVLRERISNLTNVGHLRNLGMVAGTSLFVVGISLATGADDLGPLAWLIGGIGLILTAAGWFWPARSSKDGPDQ